MRSIVIRKRETKQPDALLPEEGEGKDEPQTVKYEASDIEVRFSVQSDTLLRTTVHTDHPTETFATYEALRQGTNCCSSVSFPLNSIRIRKDDKQVDRSGEARRGMSSHLHNSFGEAPLPEGKLSAEGP